MIEYLFNIDITFRDLRINRNLRDGIKWVDLYIT